MHLLNKKMETEVRIENKLYQVNLSFDNILTLLEVLEDATISNTEKIIFGIYTLLNTTLDLSIEKQSRVLDGLMKNFVNTEEEETTAVDIEGNPMPMPKKNPVCDLQLDSEYIYTSFKQVYNIDLFEEQGKLDWRKFKMLLRDLPNDTKFKQVVEIRQRPYPKGKGTSEEKRKLKMLKQHYSLQRGQKE